MASTTVEKDIAAVGLIRSNGQAKTKDASSTDNETVCESMPEWAIRTTTTTSWATHLSSSLPFSSPTYIDGIGIVTGMAVLCSGSNQL